MNSLRVLVVHGFWCVLPHIQPRHLGRWVPLGWPNPEQVDTKEACLIQCGIEGLSAID